MIREVIRTSQSDIHIKIPREYINRDLELIVFALDEKNSEIKNKSLKKNSSSLRGIFNEYADISKISLESDVWQKNVIDKFKKDD